MTYTPPAKPYRLRWNLSGRIGHQDYSDPEEANRMYRWCRGKIDAGHVGWVSLTDCGQILFHHQSEGFVRTAGGGIRRDEDARQAA